MFYTDTSIPQEIINFWLNSNDFVLLSWEVVIQPESSEVYRLDVLEVEDPYRKNELVQKIGMLVKMFGYNARDRRQ